MMQVFIAEKPSQGRDIARILGCYQKGEGYLAKEGIVTTWGFGHLLHPASPECYDERYKKWTLDDLPIIPEKWKLEPNAKSTTQLRIVKKFINEASEVVIATDADREGELIARLILGYVRYNGPIKRLWLSALDDASIKKALAQLKEGTETENLFWAGLGRQRADWLCGMSYSRASTLVFGGHGNVFSVGRVQTPTLRLIVERDREIENFNPKPYYQITAVFDDINCDWMVPDAAKGDDQGRCLHRSFAEQVVQKCLHQQGFIETCETKKKSQPAPLPLSLSELQKIGNNKYGYNAKTILNTAQALYETHKATTYPRSDCSYLPLSQFSEAKNITSNLEKLCPEYGTLIQKCNLDYQSRCWNDIQVSESSHHAIIPIDNPKVLLSNMSDIERNIFDIIVRYYLAQFMGNYIFNETIIKIICQDEYFRTKGIIPLETGWKAAINKQFDKNHIALPAVNKGDQVTCQAIELHDKLTTPPAHYVDSTLIAAMKNCGRQVEDAHAKKTFAEVQGIGTEATRADIMETLKQRNYVKNNGKFIISTTKGREIIQQLPDGLSNIIITAQWEQKLSEVAKGQAKYNDFIRGIEESLKANIEIIKAMDGKIKKVVENPCPECGKTLIRHKKKQGKGYWWGCSGYKSGCKITMDDHRGNPKPRVKPLYSKIQCPICQNHMLIQRTGKKGKFWSCSGYPDCKATFNDRNGKPQIADKL